MVGDFFDIFSKYISSFLRRSKKRPKREVGQGSLVVSPRPRARPRARSIEPGYIAQHRGVGVQRRRREPTTALHPGQSRTLSNSQDRGASGGNPDGDLRPGRRSSSCMCLEALRMITLLGISPLSSQRPVAGIRACGEFKSYMEVL
jgi:hypothetical protein